MPASFARVKSSGLIDHRVPDVLADKPLTKGGKCSVFKCLSDPSHEVQIEMQVMHRDQAKTENFFRLDQVADVSAGKGPASEASALLFDRGLRRDDRGCSLS